jgi:hypothetical protein
MAPIGVMTAVVLALLQFAIAQYLKHRSMHDSALADNAAQVIFY